MYCRVSTKEQVEEGNSLVTQEKICREYAARCGFTISKVFIEEGESAKTQNRPQLQNLLNYCSHKKYQITAVIVYKIDRLSRNMDDYSDIRIRLRDYGILIRSTSEQFDSNPAGRFMENILANVAQFDNDVRTERSVNGMKEAVRAGRYVWKAPMGYLNTKVNGLSTIDKDPVKAPLVKEAFEMLASTDVSLIEVRDHLLEKGLKISLGYLYRLIQNKIYYGLMTQFSEMNIGNFPALISEETFYKVQVNIIVTDKPRTYKILHDDFPLRRFVKHPNGCKLTGSWSRGKAGAKFPYYRLPLQGHNFNKQKFEELFCDFLNEFSLDRNYLIKLQTKIKFLFTNKISLLKQFQFDKKEMIERLKKERSAIIKKSLQNAISNETLHYEEQRINKEISDCQQNICNQDYEQFKIQDCIKLVNSFALNPGNHWQTANVNTKRRIQEYIFPQGITYEKNEFRTPKISILFKHFRKISVQNSPVVSHRNLTNNTLDTPNTPSDEDIEGELLTSYMELVSILQEGRTSENATSS